MVRYLYCIMSKLGYTNYKKDTYEEEPVKYCKHCLSLKIRELEGQQYCDTCGSTDIKESNVFEWEKLYVILHGEKFLNL